MRAEFRIYAPEETEASKVVLMDVRRLVEFRAGHIPGAISLPFANLITIKGLAFDVPPKAEIERLLTERGIKRSDALVAYDNFYGKQAARFIYTLELYGHVKVGLLDRTYNQYLKAGGRVEESQHLVRAGARYISSIQSDKIIDKSTVSGFLKAQSHLFVDARVKSDYDMGHIPGAVNIPWTEIIAQDRILRAQEEFDLPFKQYKLNKERPILTYCDEGTSSALLTYALRASGYTTVINYYLSYGEWGADPRLPKATNP